MPLCLSVITIVLIFHHVRYDQHTYCRLTIEIKIATKYEIITECQRSYRPHHQDQE